MFSMLEISYGMNRIEDSSLINVKHIKNINEIIIILLIFLKLLFDFLILNF